MLLCSGGALLAQDKKKFSIGGSMGVWYEGYGLTVKPTGGTFFLPRKPWNQLRIDFSPTIKMGDFSLPFNFNFSALQTNFVTPQVPGKQNIGQILLNPLNNFGLNPKYKWAELQLGTQYLRYSDLSTGDIGVFGYGFDLRPGKFRIKFFNGISQRGINNVPVGPPPIAGTYERSNWMAQIGMEKEENYELAFNFAKGRDRVSSLTAPPLPTSGILPQEGFTLSLVVNKWFKKGWYFKSEGAQSYYTTNLTDPVTTTGVKSFQPFIESRTSTGRDFAATAALGRKTTAWELGAKVKYLGAGFQTLGYPFMQPDRFDYTLDTKFKAWKKKMSINASVGQRVNNISNTTTRSRQFIGNINWFTQFNDAWNLNVNFNNFGFRSVGTITNPFGIKNVANDLGINPSYTYTGKNSTHLFNLSYNWSKFDELDPITGNTTANNTHMAIFTYVPTFFKKTISPDFSLLYFYNKTPLPIAPFQLKTSMLTFSSGLAFPVAKKKANLRGQLQYTMNKVDNFKPNHNIIATASADWKMTKKLGWQLSMTSNLFKYGDQLLPINNPSYWESTLRTGFKYSFE